MSIDDGRARWEAANSPVPEWGWDALPEEERRAWLEKPLGECDWCRQAITGPKSPACVNPEHIPPQNDLRTAAKVIRRDLLYGGSGHPFYAAIVAWFEREAGQAERVIEPDMWGVADDLAVRAARGFLGK